MKYIIAFVLIVFSAVTFADGNVNCSDRFEVSFGGWSHHWTRHDDYGNKWNESHGMVGVDCNGFNAATFVNSFHIRTYAVGYETSRHNFPDFVPYHEKLEYSIYAALWSGYKYADIPTHILPVIAPKISFHAYKKLYVDTMVLYNDAVTVSFTLRF